MNKTLYLIAFVYFIFFSISYGQNIKSKISGQILNPDSDVVEFATVTIQEINRSDITNEKGYYNLKVNPGVYTLVVQHLGYKTIYKKVQVKPNEDIKQDFKFQIDSKLMDEVTLYTKQPIDKVRESAYNVVAIDAKALHNTSLDVAGALDRVSGIKVRTNGGEGSEASFSMNGFSGRHVRFFIDGVPMEGFGESFRITNLPITLVDRIEVYKGVIPIEFGSDALGGVVNIITNKSKKTNMDASFSFGSFNTYKSNINLNKIFKNDLVVQLNAFQNYSDNNYEVNVPILDFKTGILSKELSKVKRFNDRFQNATVIGKLGVQNKKYADRLFFGFTYGEGKSGVQTGTEMKKVFGEKARRSVTIMPSVEYLKKDFLVPNLDLVLTGNYNFGHTQNIDTASYRYNWAGERVEQSKQGESGGGASLTKFFNNNASTTINVSYKLADKHSFSVNHAFYYFNRKTEDPLAVKETEAEKKADLKRISYKNITSLSYKFDVLDNLNFSAFGKNYSISQVYDDETRKSSSKGYGIAATYLFNDIQVKTSFEKTYRLPTNGEIFGDGDMEWGNEYLKPEQGNNFNLNLSYSTIFDKKHAFFLDGGFAYRNMRDYIRRSIYAGGSRASSENIAGVLSTGFNLEARYIYNGVLQIGGTFTDQKIVNKQKYISGGFGIENSYYNERMPNEPYLFGSADLAWTFMDVLKEGNKLLLGYNLRYIHKYTYDFKSIGADSKWIPTQLAHDLSASYSIMKNTLHFTLEANNFTDSEVYDNFSFQKPGRSFMFKIRYLYN